MTATLAIAVLAAGWAVTLLATMALLRSERREAARERNLLTNQLLHLAGRTWQEPPSQQPEPVASDPGLPDLIRPSQHLEL